MSKQYIVYLIRWQMSTPVLALVLWLLSDWGALASTVVANLIGGLAFYWVDKLIFRQTTAKRDGTKVSSF